MAITTGHVSMSSYMVMLIDCLLFVVCWFLFVVVVVVMVVVNGG
jgi:hypothetical protein